MNFGEQEKWETTLDVRMTELTMAVTSELLMYIGEPRGMRRIIAATF
jgi:hypothetical protein